MNNNPHVTKYSIAQRQKQLITILAHMLHSEQGMQRITTAKLAQELGVSEAALYRYYPSKTKMFEALIDNIEQMLVERINQIYTVETKTDARIYHTLKTILDFSRKNPGFTRILTGHALMFENINLQERVAKFFDLLELKLLNILEMRKIREKQPYINDEKLIASYFVLFCEGQFIHNVRTNFRLDLNADFAKQWPLLKKIME